MQRYTRQFLETRLGYQLREAGVNFVLKPWVRKDDDTGARAIVGCVFLEGQRNRWSLYRMHNEGGAQTTVYAGDAAGLVAFGDGVEFAVRVLKAAA